MPKFIILGMLFFPLNKAFAQEIKKWSDSVAVSFLRGHEIGGGDIGIKKDTINGKVKIGKNYYCYESFRLKVTDTCTIFLMNFGAYDSEGKNYIMVIDKLITTKSFFILGENEFDDDLNRLTVYFKSKGRKLKEKYKIEICDLFLRSKRGQIETPKYIY